MNFQLDIISIRGKLFSGEVQEVILPSVDGEIVVLSRHMPMMTPLTLGEVVVKSGEETLSFSIGKGMFATEGVKAVILAEDIFSSDEISEERALEAKRKAEEILSKGVSGEEKLQAIYSLRKSLVDLKIVRRKKRKLF